MENLVLNFEQANELFKNRPEKHRRSVALESDVRLVPLAPDRFGVQYKNTYVVRICSNGLYVINLGPQPDKSAPVISRYSPMKIFCREGRWMTPFGPYHGACVVDATGREVTES